MSDAMIILRKFAGNIKANHHFDNQWKVLTEKTQRDNSGGGKINQSVSTNGS